MSPRTIVRVLHEFLGKYKAPDSGEYIADREVKVDTKGNGSYVGQVLALEDGYVTIETVADHATNLSIIDVSQIEVVAIQGPRYRWQELAFQQYLVAIASTAEAKRKARLAVVEELERIRTDTASQEAAEAAKRAEIERLADEKLS